MQHAFIMDSPTGIKAWKDTTYFLMLACVQRGHRVCHLDQSALWLQQDRLWAEVTWVRVNDDIDRPFDQPQRATLPLDDMDAVWVRTDPPLDRRYFYTTLLLDYLPESTRVLNRPAGIRNWNEKLAALKFPHLTPATCVTCRIDTIKHFSRQHERVVIKPIDGFGGKGIVFYRADDADDVLRQATRDQSHRVIVQAYLPTAAQGDKRVLLLNGDVLGGILRLHGDQNELNNLDLGATAHPTELNQHDLEICAELKPRLIEQGIFLAGIDIIGDRLIEVNVTSPTGLQELSRFEQTDFHHRIIAALE